MSSTQSNIDLPSRRASGSSENHSSRDVPEPHDASVTGPTGVGLPPPPPESKLLVASQDARQIIRLIQCGICSRLLEEPTTLPCGQSLCKRCLPEAHVRTNISWPATASRRHGFVCPFPDCGKEHAVSDCSIDVTLNKALTNIRTAIEGVRDTVEASDVATNVTKQDSWDVAGLPSLAEKENQSQVIRGGKIWATYELVYQLYSAP